MRKENKEPEKEEYQYKAKRGKYVKNRYYDVPEEELQVLLKEAKEGNDKSQNRLLEIFQNFLQKYSTLLCTGHYLRNDQDIRRFIGLFVKQPKTRYALLKNNMGQKEAKEVREVIRGITYMVQRHEEADVVQTVSMSFLQAVSRYERQGSIPFSGYLYSYFFYLLKKNVELFLIDQLGRKTFPIIDSETTDRDEHDKPQEGFKLPPAPPVEDLINADEIDELWVAGDTAHYPFDRLTVQERQLLKWRFVDEKRATEIAQGITQHSNTTREEVQRVKQRIVDIVSKDEELDWVP